MQYLKYPDAINCKKIDKTSNILIKLNASKTSLNC